MWQSFHYLDKTPAFNFQMMRLLSPRQTGTAQINRRLKDSFSCASPRRLKMGILLPNDDASGSLNDTQTAQAAENKRPDRPY